MLDYDFLCSIFATQNSGDVILAHAARMVPIRFAPVFFVMLLC